MNTRPALLSTLWIFLSANWICCDVLSLMDPPTLRSLLAGGFGGVPVSQVFLLASAVLLEIPFLLIPLSRCLPRPANRPLQLAAAGFLAVVQVGSFAVGDPPTLHYLFFSAVELAGLAFVAHLARTWPPQTESVPPSASPRNALPVLAAILVAATAAAADGNAGETPAPPACGTVFLAAPVGLRASNSLLGLGLGWRSPAWIVRLDALLADAPQEPRDPTAIDLSAGLDWTQEAAPTLSLYEGLAIGNRMAVSPSSDGNVWYANFLAGCELRPSRAVAFFLEAGSGFAVVRRKATDAGAASISAGLRYAMNGGG